MKIHSKGNEIGYHGNKPVYEWITFSSNRGHDDVKQEDLIRVKFSRLPFDDRDGRPRYDLKDGEITVAGCGGIYL